MDFYAVALCFAACAFAALAGFAARHDVAARLRMKGYRRKLGAERQSMQMNSGAKPDVLDRVLALAARLSHRSQAQGSKWSTLARLCEPADLEKRCLLAGLASTVNASGFFEARLMVVLAGAAGGFVLGFMGSGILALLLGIAGAAFGWLLPSYALTAKARQRVDDVERCLPEMLDVVSLGLRSGLSFDRSLEFYLDNFDNLLASAMRLARDQYAQGLVARDEALVNMAASFDSPALSQVVGSIVRSLRFGASLAEPLEDAARQARANYKARKEEEVAKAPVKMMVPTGTLILPAMLILVLGPVMLELAGGA